MKDGKYTLKENLALGGYILNDKEYEFVISNGKIISSTLPSGYTISNYSEISSSSSKVSSSSSSSKEENGNVVTESNNNNNHGQGNGQGYGNGNDQGKGNGSGLLQTGEVNTNLTIIVGVVILAGVAGAVTMLKRK